MRRRRAILRGPDFYGVVYPTCGRYNNGQGWRGLVQFDDGRQFRTRWTKNRSKALRWLYELIEFTHTSND